MRRTRHGPAADAAGVMPPITINRPRRMLVPDAENASTDDADVVDSEDTLGLDDRAWRRLATVLGVHVDPASGDIVTLAVMDSLEIGDPYALLAVTTEMGLALHGPFDADTAAPRLVASDSTVAQTRPVRLHHPDQPALPDDAWPPPADVAGHGRRALADPRAGAIATWPACLVTALAAATWTGQDRR